MKKRISQAMTIMITIAIMIMSVPSTVMAGSASDLRNSVAPIAVLLEIADPSTKEVMGIRSLGTGTCFFVGEKDKDPQCLVTNYHVAQEYFEYGKGEWIDDVATIGGKWVNIIERVTLRVYLNNKKEYVEAYPISNSAYDETRDIAFLRLNSPLADRKPVEFLEPGDELVSSHVYAIGYPGIADNNLADPISSWGIEDATIVDGIISRFVTQTGTGTRFIQSTATFSPGHSGSPLVTDDGYVIGMNTWYVSTTMGNQVYYSVDSRDIINLMDANNIKYAMAGESSGSGSSDDAKGETAEQETAPPAETTPTPPTQPVPEPASGIPGWAIGAIVGVVALAAIAIAAIMISGKKKQTPAQTGVTQPVMSQMPKKEEKKQQGVPVVRSLSVQHNGERVALKGKQILIGRDTSANIRFKEGTPGVSGRHCTVSYDQATGDFLLTDLKSSYGTFLKNDQKLQAGQVYRLKAGDSFYLGEKANELRVELG